MLHLFFALVQDAGLSPSDPVWMQLHLIETCLSHGCGFLLIVLLFDFAR